MYRGDKIPELSKTQPFPLGDITDPDKDKRVSDWFEAVESLDRTRFMAKVQADHIPTPIIATMGPYRNYQATYRLCHKWDLDMGANNYLARNGLSMMMAFSRKTLYLPSPKVDLSDQLGEMLQSNDLPQTARAFGQTAWRSITRYPRVHATFERLLDHAKSRYNIIPEDNYDHFMAGMALPFMVSLTSKLIEETPKFTGMTTEKHDLGRVAFGELFTNEVAPAPNVILPAPDES